MTIRDEDIEVYAYSILVRSRGGQQCGIEPGVIVIHRPTGVSYVDRSERSQFKARASAMHRLRDILYTLEAAGALPDAAP